MGYRGEGANFLIVPVVAGVVSTSETAGYVRLGSFSLNLDSLTPKNLVVVISGVFETSNAANHYHVRLFDVTAAAVVGADPLIDNNKTTPTGTGAPVTLSSGEHTYEVQMKMSAGVAPDKVTCSSSWVVILYDDA